MILKLIKKNAKIILGVVLIFIFIVVYFFAKHYGFIHLLSNIHLMKKYLRSFGTSAYIVYFFLCIFVAIFMLPDFMLTIASGICFGAMKGTLLSLFGDAIGATCAFFIARYFARDFISKKFEGNKIFKKIENGVKKDGITFLVITRLVPIFPFSLQSYAYGLTSMKSSIFIIVTFIAMIPGTFAFAYMANDIAKNGLSNEIILKLTIIGIILFFISFIPKIIATKRGMDIGK